MKKHAGHTEILGLIIKHSGNPTQHTFSDSYLGNTHPRYPINAPTLRRIAKEWMRAHRGLNANELMKLITSLVKGESATEKTMAGILLDNSTPSQRKFDAKIFDEWLDHLEGWAEVDAVCTGAYTISEIPGQWSRWKKLLVRFSKSKNINKRRASLVLLCSPLRIGVNSELAAQVFQTVDLLQSEKDVLITKAISWVLRSAAKHHKALVRKYVTFNRSGLPKIAVRETLTLLKTGRKTRQRDAFGTKTKAI